MPIFTTTVGFSFEFQHWIEDGTLVVVCKSCVQVDEGTLDTTLSEKPWITKSELNLADHRVHQCFHHVGKLFSHLRVIHFFFSSSCCVLSSFDVLA